MSPTSRRLLWALRGLALVVIGLVLAAPWFTEQVAWGLWPATYLPAFWRWALALPAAALALWGDRLSGLARRARFPATWPWPWARVPVALLAAVPFYLFRIVHTRWGDAYILVNSIAHPEVRLTYSWQAPLDVFLHAKAWAAAQALFGWRGDAMPVYWLISAAAGVAFVWVLLGLAVWLGRDTTERCLIAGLVGTLGTMQLFFGYIENYTLMTLGVLIYIWLALRALRGEISLFWPALALALSHGLHPSTLVLAPSLLFVWWQAARRARTAPTPGHRLRVPGGATNLLSVALPYAVVGLGVLALMTAGGHGLGALFGADAPGGGDHNWFVPLFRTSTRWERYTMFSGGHLADMVNEQLLAAPIILPALLFMALLTGRRMRAAYSTRTLELTPATLAEGGWDAPTLQFLTLTTGLYLLLIWTWNADYGGQRDWDLFAPAAIPAAVWLAYLLPRVLPERRALAGAGWALVAAQALHTAAWIYQNTRPWSWS